MIRELSTFFNERFTHVFYVYPVGTNVGGKREEHIRQLRRACMKQNVQFGDFAADGASFIHKLSSQPITHRLVYLDDVALSLLSSPEGLEAFTILSRHMELSLVFTTQNMFLRAPHAVGIRRALTDFLIFLSPNEIAYQKEISQTLFSKPNFLNSCLAWLIPNVPKTYDRYILYDRNEVDPTIPPSHFKMFSIRTCLFPKEKERPVGPDGEPIENDDSDDEDQGEESRLVVYLSPPQAK
jgi:hypothetical protein